LYQFRANLDPLTVFVVCAPTKTLYWPVALVAFQGALGFVGLFFAFKTRNIFDRANESKENSLITFNLMFVGLVIIFLLYLVELSPSGSYAIQAIGILWIAGTTVAIIFVPRVYEFITGRPFNDSTSGGLRGRVSVFQGGEYSTEADNNRSMIASKRSKSTTQSSGKNKTSSS
jgi:uncharacterized membrane protein